MERMPGYPHVCKHTFFEYELTIWAHSVDIDKSYYQNSYICVYVVNIKCSNAHTHTVLYIQLVMYLVNIKCSNTHTHTITYLLKRSFAESF